MKNHDQNNNFVCKIGMFLDSTCKEAFLELGGLTLIQETNWLRECYCWDSQTSTDFRRWHVVPSNMKNTATGALGRKRGRSFNGKLAKVFKREGIWVKLIFKARLEHFSFFDLFVLIVFLVSRKRIICLSVIIPNTDKWRVLPFNRCLF